MLLLLSLFLSIGWTAARSAGIYVVGDVYGCDFDGVTTNWGCPGRQWNTSTGFIPNVTRAMCLDTNGNGGGRFMWWVGGPQAPPANTWSIRTGDGAPANDVKSYIPGSSLSVYVRVLKFNQLYKGLLMYAKDSNNAKVGNWNVPYEASPIFSDDKVHKCNRSIMHLNAEDKPYVVKFNFLAPPAGTGTITIRAMLKTGPPNPTEWGSFHKMPVLTLTEVTNPVPQNGHWYPLLNQTLSCTDFCREAKLKPCDAATLSQNLDKSQGAYDQVFPCHGALFHDCAAPGVKLTTPDNFCTFRGASCTGAKASCAAKSDATKTLFCICGAYVGVANSGSRAIPGFATVLVALMSSWALGRFRLGGLMFLGVLLLGASPVQGHNWMEGTRGRAAILGASQFCSPTYPQLNRNEIHLQVVANQEFVVEWAAAHTDYTYWIVISDNDRDKVGLLTRSVMDGYLANCTTSNFANDTSTTKPKFHRFFPNFNLQSQEPVNSATALRPNYNDTFESTPIYSGPIWDAFGDRSTAFFNGGGMGVCTRQTGMYNDTCILPFNATAFPKTMLAAYRPQYMMNDRRCSYVNPSYPWIESIARFQHSDASRSFATALLSIPARQGPGRYQVHYKWSSYCDVMDVDVPAGTTLVANPYGTRINATQTVYNLGQHCWFESPRLVGQCIEVVTDTNQCAAICNQDGGCKAYQLLPLQMNPTVSGDSWGLFPESQLFDWRDTQINTTWCNKTQFVGKNIPDKGAMVCFLIYQFQDDFNSARPLWSFTQDMNHQGFYGTCYIKPRPVQFLNPKILPELTDNTFRFFDRCIPCDNLKADLATPRWGPMQKVCDDCALYTGPPRAGPKIPTWTAVGAGTFLDKAHWLSPGGSPYATADECKILAARDPTCSKFVMHSQNRTDRIQLIGNTYNLNSSIPLFSGTNGYHFTNSSFSNSYYRTCACLDLTVITAAKVADITTYVPNVDVNQTVLACDGIASKTQCAVRSFNIFRLA